MAHDLGKWARFLALQVQGDIGPMTFYTSTRGKAVAFPRSPPLNPPTAQQETIRDIFRTAAVEWRTLTPAQQSDWRRAATAANLGISGYNLFTWFWYTHNYQTIRAIERNTGITLQLPP